MSLDNKYCNKSYTGWNRIQEYYMGDRIIIPLGSSRFYFKSFFKDAKLSWPCFCCTVFLELTTDLYCYQGLAKTFWAKWIHDENTSEAWKKKAFFFRKVILSINYGFFSKTSSQYIFLLWWDTFFIASSATETFLHPGYPLMFSALGSYRESEQRIIWNTDTRFWRATFYNACPVFFEQLSK